MKRLAVTFALLSVSFSACAASADFCEQRGQNAVTYLVAKHKGLKEEWVVQAINSDADESLAGKLGNIDLMHSIYGAANDNLSHQQVREAAIKDCRASLKGT